MKLNSGMLETFGETERRERKRGHPEREHQREDRGFKNSDQDDDHQYAQKTAGQNRTDAEDRRQEVQGAEEQRQLNEDQNGLQTATSLQQGRQRQMRQERRRLGRGGILQCEVPHQPRAESELQGSRGFLLHLLR